MLKLVEFFDESDPSTGPNGIREGKFVHLTDGERDFLLFAPVSICKYHADIVERYARSRGIKILRTDDMTTIIDPGWRILGGGMLRIDVLSHTMEFSGASKAYGRFYPDKIRKAMAANSELSRYHVGITE